MLGLPTLVNRIPTAQKAQRSRRVGFAGIVLLLSLLYCVGAWRGLQVPVKGVLTLYLHVLFYNSIVFPIAMMVLLNLFVLMVIRIFRRFSIALWLGVGLFICGGLFVQYLVGYTHLDSAELNGHVYHLGEKSSEADEYSYTLCECDGWGLFCRCNDFYWVTGFSYPPASWRLNVDHSANELRVQVNDVMIYSYGESPRCYERLPVYGGCIKQ